MRIGTHPSILDICFNLWLVVDQQMRLVYAYMGKAYALRGSDEDKLRILQSLSADDHHTVPRRKLPERFSVVSADGELKGVATLDIARSAESRFFEELFEQLQKELPMQPRFILGKTVQYPIPVSKAPLCVTTVLLESKHGILFPQVNPPIS